MSRAMQFDIVANDKASGTMSNVDKSMANFGKSVSSQFTMLAGRAVAVYATITKVAAVLNDLGQASDAAARMGLTVEEYTKLKFAAEQYGSSIEEIAKAQKDVNKLMDEAATKPGGDQFKTLQALGFSESDIINRNIKVAEVFERIGEAIKGASSEEEKFAIASRVFGDKISQSMVPVLENYKEFQSVQASATSMSQKSADALDRAGERMTGFFNFVKQLAGEAVGRAVIAMEGPNPVKVVTPEEKAANANRTAKTRAALLAIGNKPVVGDKTGGEVSSMAAIGGASFRGVNIMGAKPIEEQQLEQLQTIAANTSPSGAMMSPVPGSTDITKGGYNLVDDINQIIGTPPPKPKSFMTYKMYKALAIRK